jgi:general stress protein CsbA
MKKFTLKRYNLTKAQVRKNCTDKEGNWLPGVLGILMIDKGINDRGEARGFLEVLEIPSDMIQLILEDIEPELVRNLQRVEQTQVKEGTEAKSSPTPDTKLQMATTIFAALLGIFFTTFPSILVSLIVTDKDLAGQALTYLKEYFWVFPLGVVALVVGTVYVFRKIFSVKQSQK